MLIHSNGHYSQLIISIASRAHITQHSLLYLISLNFQLSAILQSISESLVNHIKNLVIQRLLVLEKWNALNPQASACIQYYWILSYRSISIIHKSSSFKASAQILAKVNTHGVESVQCLLDDIMAFVLNDAYLLIESCIFVKHHYLQRRLAQFCKLLHDDLKYLCRSQKRRYSKQQ